MTDRPMTAQEFRSHVARARMLRESAGDIDDQHYWEGYQRGLRRAYHGERFATEQEHRQWLGLVHSRNELRRRRGEGYIDALALGEQVPPATEFVRLRKAAGHTQQSLAEASGWSLGWIRDVEQGRTDCPTYAVWAMRYLAEHGHITE